jgi:hypothetical protein
MNMKRFLLGSVGSFVGMMLMGFLLHANLLQASYLAAPAGLLRAPSDERFPFIMGGYLLFAIAATWIYAYGVERKAWLGQGIRYGIALWVLGSLSPSMVMYAIQPWPADLAMKTTAADLAIALVGGLIIAAVYKESAGIPRSSGATA